MKTAQSPDFSEQDAWSLRTTLLFIACVSLVRELTYPLGFWHWNIGVGLEFCALWILPRRRWWIFILTAILSNFARGAFLIDGMYFDESHVLGYWSSYIQAAMGNVFPPFVAMAGVQLLVDHGIRIRSENTPHKFKYLIGAALTCAVLQALKDLVYVMDDRQVGELRMSKIVNMVALNSDNAPALLFQFGFMHLAGAFLGVLLVTPIAMWVLSRPKFRNNRPVVISTLTTLTPIVAAFLLATLLSGLIGIRPLFRLLLVASVVVLALRHGWRGAFLSLVVVSVVVAWQDHIGSFDVQPWLLQAFLAITGATALLFGALMDANRAQLKRLRASSRMKARLHHHLALAAAGNLARDTNERQRIAGALHDEFGQNLTAFQTHLRLLKPEFTRANRLETLQELDGITNSMRQSVRKVLEKLRPTALDELGLYGAIDQGFLRQSAENAGMRYTVDLLGDARLLAALHDSVRVAAYRLVQETVNGAVQHARASYCRVRLRIDHRAGQTYLFVDIRDDGDESVDTRIQNRDLAAIQDHVTALGGTLHLQTGNPGFRLHALFRQGRHV
jgi:two-component system sensor histidine kinase UhpB